MGMMDILLAVDCDRKNEPPRGVPRGIEQPNPRDPRRTKRGIHPAKAGSTA
jgi:hypothetical protein